MNTIQKLALVTVTALFASCSRPDTAPPEPTQAQATAPTPTPAPAPEPPPAPEPKPSSPVVEIIKEPAIEVGTVVYLTRRIVIKTESGLYAVEAGSAVVVKQLHGSYVDVKCEGRTLTVGGNDVSIKPVKRTPQAIPAPRPRPQIAATPTPTPTPTPQITEASPTPVSSSLNRGAYDYKKQVSPPRYWGQKRR